MLFQSGLAAYQAGHYLEALEQFEEAHRIYGELGQWWSQLALNASIGAAQQRVLAGSETVVPDSETETGSETGLETGSETGLETNSETGLETNSETNSETGSETGPKADEDEGNAESSEDGALVELQELFDLGKALSKEGQAEKALEAYNAALGIALGLEDYISAGRLLNEIGATHESADEFAEALEAYNEAYVIWVDLEDNENTIRVLMSMADIERAREENQAALSLYRQALDLTTADAGATGDTPATDELRRLALLQTAIGDISYRIEAYADAEVAYLATAPIWQQLESTDRQLRALRNAARARGRAGDIGAAVDIYLEGIDTAQAVGAITTQAALLDELGNTYRTLEQYDDALAVLRVSQSIWQSEANQVGYATSLVQTGDAYRALGDDEDALATYQEALKIMTAEGEEYTAARLLDTVAGYRSQLRQFSEASNAYLTAAELWAAQGRTGSQVRSLRYAARAFDAKDDLEAALSTYSTAVDIAAANDEPEIFASALDELGNAYRAAEEYGLALDTLDRAQAIWEATDNVRNLLDTLDRIGDTYRDMGNTNAALSKYQEALNLAQESSETEAQASLLDTLGGYALGLEQYGEALDYLTDAQRTWQELEQPGRELRTLRSMADAHGRSGNFAAGITAYEDALSLARGLEDSRAEAGLLSRLARHYQNFNFYSDAIATRQAEIGIWQDEDEPVRLVDSLISLAGAYQKAGLGASVRQTYFQALDLANQRANDAEDGDDSGADAQIATIRDALGGYYQGIRQYPESLTNYQLALGLWQADDNAARSARTLSSIASVNSAQGNHEQATNIYLQALSVARNAENQSDEANMLNALGRHYSFLKRYPEALDAYRGAFAIWSSLGESEKAQSARLRIWSTHVSLQEYGAALTWATQPIGISQPFRGATVSDAVEIEGLAGHAQFDKWQIDLLANGDESQAIYIGRGARPTWGRLLTLDTTLYPNGPYTIRLRIVREGKNYDEYFSNLVINNNQAALAQRVKSAANGFTAPLAGSAAFGILRVEGVADHDDFEKWELDLLQFGEVDQVIQLQTRSRPSSGRLYSLDTQAYPNGSHTLRLRVVRGDSNYDEFYVDFTINN